MFYLCIVMVNVNGIRVVVCNGMSFWLDVVDIDIFILQEVCGQDEYIEVVFFGWIFVYDEVMVKG